MIGMICLYNFFFNIKIFIS